MYEQTIRAGDLTNGVHSGRQVRCPDGEWRFILGIADELDPFTVTRLDETGHAIDTKTYDRGTLIEVVDDLDEPHADEDVEALRFGDGEILRVRPYVMPELLARLQQGHPVVVDAEWADRQGFGDHVVRQGDDGTVLIRP